MANTSSHSVTPTHIVRLTADARPGATQPKQGQWFIDGTPLGSPVGPPFTLETTVPADGERHTFTISPVGSSMAVSAPGGTPIIGNSGSASVKALAPICGAHDGKGEVLARPVVGKCAGPDASSGDHDKRNVTLSFESNLPGGVWVQWFRDGVAIDQPVRSGKSIVDKAPISSSPVEYGLINYGSNKPQKLSPNTGFKSAGNYDDTVAVSLGPCEVTASIKSVREIEACNYAGFRTLELLGSLTGDHSTGLGTWQLDGKSLTGVVAIDSVTAAEIFGDGQSHDVTFLLNPAPNVSFAGSDTQAVTIEECRDAILLATDQDDNFPAGLDTGVGSPRANKDECPWHSERGCPSSGEFNGSLHKANYWHVDDTNAAVVDNLVPLTVEESPQRAAGELERYPQFLYASATHRSDSAWRELVGSFAPTKSYDAEFWRKILSPHLRPKGELSSGRHPNVYFMNGMQQTFANADNQREMLSDYFFGVQTVRLIYNDRERLGIGASGASGQVKEVKEMANSYSWLFETSYKRAFAGDSAHNATQEGKYDRSYEILSALAVLVNGFLDDARVGLAGTSHGTLITAQAVLAFARMFPEHGLAWLKKRVRLVGVGSLVPIERYAVLSALLERYEAHTDPEDHVARIWSGHHRTIGIPKTSDQDYVRSEATDPSALAVLAVEGSQRSHGIEKNYVTTDQRHASREFFVDKDHWSEPVTSLRAVVWTEDRNNAGSYDRHFLHFGSTTLELGDTGVLKNFAQGTTEIIDLPIPSGLVLSDLQGQMKVTKTSHDGWHFGGIQLEANGELIVRRYGENQLIRGSIDTGQNIWGNTSTTSKPPKPWIGPTVG